jgi:hypothetical protein
MRSPRPLTFEQLQRLPPETLALALLQRVPDRGAVLCGQVLSQVLRDARPTPPGQVITHTEHLFDEFPPRRWPWWRPGNGWCSTA